MDRHYTMDRHHCWLVRFCFVGVFSPLICSVSHFSVHLPLRRDTVTCPYWMCFKIGTGIRSQYSNKFSLSVEPVYRVR
jgi:hypothetical protein